MIGRIYCLIDPLTSDIRYIGQTRGELNFRLTSHFKDRNQLKNKNNYNAHWISKLYSEHHVKPKISLLEDGVFNNNELDSRELFWISKALEIGYDLTNTRYNLKNMVVRFPKGCSGKRVYCYDRSCGLKIYNNSRDINRKLGISYKKISEDILSEKASNLLYVFSYTSLDVKIIEDRFKKYDDKYKSILIARNIKTSEEITFKNQADAANALNLNFRNISLCLLGSRISCGGYIWRYTHMDFLLKEPEYEIINVITGDIYKTVKEGSIKLNMKYEDIYCDLIYNKKIVDRNTKYKRKNKNKKKYE